MKFLDDFTNRLLIYMLVVLVMTMGMTYVTYKYITCPKYGNAIEKNVKFDFWAGGCFVEMDNGQWIGRHNYKGFNLE